MSEIYIVEVKGNKMFRCNTFEEAQQRKKSLLLQYKEEDIEIIPKTYLTGESHPDPKTTILG